MDNNATIAARLDEVRLTIDTQVESAATAFYDQVQLPFAGAIYEPLMDAVAGGKRFRALCATTGAAIAQSLRHPTASATDLITRAATTPSVQALMVALEFYQAAALVHDDLLDDADTRRGRPAAHVTFENDHDRNALWGDRRAYGRDGAVLLGDLLTSAAETSLARALPDCGPKRGAALLRGFALMSGEVAVGQWADTSVSYVPLETSDDNHQQIARALQVVERKSARYSIVHPTLLGALAVGGDRHLERSLTAVLEPTGRAFQLRDDDLGAFGEADETGKPMGGDIEERKRTVLLAMTLAHAPKPEVARLQRLYAANQISAAEVGEVREILRAYGRGPHETLIKELTSEALNAVERADLPASAKLLLDSLVERVTARRS